EVVAVEPVGGEPGVERVALAGELVLPHPAELLVQPDLVLVALGRGDLAVDDLDQLLPALAPHAQLAERLERLGILAADVEHAVPQLDRLVLAEPGPGAGAGGWGDQGVRRDPRHAGV